VGDPRHIKFVLIFGGMVILSLLVSKSVEKHTIEQNRHKEAKMKLVVIHKAIEMDYDPEKLELMMKRMEE